LEIDAEIARRVRAAQRRVRICSLLINSGTLIGELGNLLRRRGVAVDGIYDRTQMEQVYLQWQEVPQNQWKISALKEIILRAGPDREKLNALLCGCAPQLHAQQSSCDRRYCDHRLL